MKKILSMLLVCVMVLSLAACGNSANTSQNETESSIPEATQEENSISETEETEISIPETTQEEKRNIGNRKRRKRGNRNGRNKKSSF